MEKTTTGKRPDPIEGSVEGAENLIEAASSAVLSAWPEHSPARGSHELRESMERVVAAIISRVRRACDDAPLQGTDRLLTRRLIEALRLQVLRHWKAGGCESADVALEVLVAIEGVRSVTLGGADRDFVQRLAEPDGFELLVELAHDIRSPLTSISFLSETLRSGRSGEVNELQKSQLALIWSAAFGMTSVVSDVLDLARDRADLLDQEPGRFSIMGLLEGVREVVGPMVEEKGIEVRIEAPDHDRVQGRRKALFRVLLNLTTNAIKFTDSGFVELQASVVERDVIEFSVRDTGRGIPEEQQATLFEPFKRSSDREGYFFSGSGLGLSIARRICHGLDSELQFETRPDWGTRFFFEVELPPVRTL